LCDDVIGCIWTHVDISFKFDGGIGGFLAAESPGAPNPISTFGRFMFDNLYNFIVMIILLSILSGIIIDRFA